MLLHGTPSPTDGQIAKIISVLSLSTPGALKGIDQAKLLQVLQNRNAEVSEKLHDLFVSLLPTFGVVRVDYSSPIGDLFKYGVEAQPGHGSFMEDFKDASDWDIRDWRYELVTFDHPATAAQAMDQGPQPFYSDVRTLLTLAGVGPLMLEGKQTVAMIGRQTQDGWLIGYVEVNRLQPHGLTIKFATASADKIWPAGTQFLSLSPTK